MSHPEPPQQPEAAPPFKGSPSLITAAAAGSATAGLWIGILTLRLNPELLRSVQDSALLLVYVTGLYLLFGLVLGLASAVLVTLAARVLGTPTDHFVRRWASTLLFLLPPLGVLALPDTGLFRSMLTDAIFGGWVAMMLVVLALVLFAVLLTWMGGGFLRAIHPGLTWTRPLAPLWIAATAAFALAAGPDQARGPGVTADVTSAAISDPASMPLQAEALPSAELPDPPLTSSAGHQARGSSPSGPTVEAPGALEPGALRPPVILLCIDGLDPDDALIPLIEAGELPTFQRLKTEGVWAELATLYPTLSPSIWTTLVTGKPPREHGVHHFVLFRLPGLSRPIRHFPLHTGLNFRLIPWLERLPGMPPIQIPYTSDLRKSPALWNILDDHMSVGVYGWRVTWPAEPVQGFNVATGVTLLDELVEAANPVHPTSRRRPQRSIYPADALRALRSQGRLPARIPNRRRALEEIVALTEAYRPAFLAAGFYSVDADQHLADPDWDVVSAGLPLQIVEAYRLADDRLGELHENLQRIYGEVNLLVVSDHGFDFEHGHHTHAPLGLFLAHGPAFQPGAAPADLEVYDVAPLVLALLERPLALDMPGTAAARFQRLLHHPRPLPQIPSYRAGHPSSQSLEEAPLDDETRKRLKALGYLN